MVPMPWVDHSEFEHAGRRDIEIALNTSNKSVTIRHVKN